MSIADWIAVVLLVGGGFFAFIAALGLVRMQDVYIRMHASTKAGTLGVGMIAAAVAMTASGEGVVKEVAIILFLLFTAPIGAHLIARAAFQSRVPVSTPGVAERTRESFVCENEVEATPATPAE
ncbi:MAG: monovalent cation/H(+) antiporter subunit G [Dinoroseobacter sp.]|nr:monovalent cation/H(+) antiporter subunit G [Dinoroseobacter sp.]MDJ0992192.1 monovalent cation/H(+) antiporter subunit G [Dinoroseobacter sp.]